MRSPVSSQHLVRLALVSLLALGVAGCDTLSSLNPFEKKQVPLPGKRVDVFTADDTLQQTTNGSASIGAPQANADWPEAGGNAANDSGSLAFAGSANRAWSTSVLGGSLGGGWFGGADTRISARPVVGGGQVYVYAPDGTLTALSLSTGGRAWQVSLRPEKERDPAIGGGVALGDGRVFVGTGYGSLFAVDPATGKTIWSKALASPARGAPAVSGGKVFIVSDQNVVYAINAADGSEAWSYRGIPESGGLLASASPAVAGNTLIAPYSSGEVMGFDIAKGEPQWSDAVTQSTRTMALSSLSDVAASPVIVGDTVYATGVSGRTIAVNSKTGERRWDQNVGSAHTPVVSGNAVFLVDLDDRAAALDRTSGRPLWSVQLPVINTKSKRTHWAGPVLAGGRLWFVSSGGEMITVNPGDGKLGPVAKIGDPAFIAPVVASGTMIVVSGIGTVAAYR